MSIPALGAGRRCSPAARSLERRNELGGRLRRLPQSSPNLLDSHQRLQRLQLQLVEDEVIRMQRLDAVRLERFCLEVAQVDFYDRVGMAGDRRGEHMPDSRVGQHKTLDQSLIAIDETVGHRRVHQTHKRLEPRRQLWPVCRQVARPLLVNPLRPTGVIGARCREQQQHVAQRRRVRRVRVEHRRNGAEPAISVAELQLLRQIGELLQRLLGPLLLCLLVAAKLFVLDPAMPSHLATAQPPLRFP